MVNKVRLPIVGPEGFLFTLKDVLYVPEVPRLEEPFTVKGKVELFGIPFYAPIWVIARVTAPETWWEHFIPIWGSPTVGEGTIAIGGNFEVTFPKGFDREGEYSLEVRAYAGPTMPLDSVILPPFPSITTMETTFIVAGEVPPEEIGFKDFRILSYSKNGGTPVEAGGVLELDVGDKCRVNVGFDHRGVAVSGKYHAAIWQERWWDPHDEILNAEKAFTVPASADWESFEDSIDIAITSKIDPGTEYGLYVKIMAIPGPDIFTEYLANVITIVGVPEEYKGTINKKQLEYNGTYKSIPVSTVPYGKRGLVHIWGRNDTSRRQDLGIAWRVYDPNGVIVEDYSDWSYGHGAGNDHEFLGDRFDLDKTGAYTMEVSLFMNPSNPVEVDRYDGKLCTVGPAILEPPEVETVIAENITHKSADIFGKLIDTSYWSRVEVFFRWGKTEACANKTRIYEMDEGDEGDEFQAELTGLEPDTTYYYKAAVDALGPRSDEVDTNYGETKSFTTEAEVVKGFTMRVENPPAGAAIWWALCCYEGTSTQKPDEPFTNWIPIDATWEWKELAPDYRIYLWVEARDSAGIRLQADGFYFRLRDGKNYVWDFAAHEMREE